jgi:hypothetical protein
MQLVLLFKWCMFLLLLMELSTADAISAVLAETAAVNVVSYCQ